MVAPALIITGDPFLPAHAWKSTMRFADAIYRVLTHPAASPSGGIDRLSLWQKQKLYNMNIEKFDDNKSYPFKYPYTYSQSNRGSLTISNEGSEKASLRIEIEGAVNNPELIITKDDKVLSRLRLYVVNSKCSIVVDSNVRNQIMTLKDSKGTKSIYENQDFEQDNFLFVDPGTYDLEFKPGVTTNTTCKIILTEFYLGN